MTTQDTAPVADQSVALHASASEGYKCADCQMDGEACPDCYKAWWQQRHPNTILVNSDSTPPDSLAVAEALEQAAKVCEDEMRGWREVSKLGFDVARAIQGKINSLIPADI